MQKVERFQCDTCYTLYEAKELARMCENSHASYRDMKVVYRAKTKFPSYIELVVAGENIKYYPSDHSNDYDD